MSSTKTATAMVFDRGLKKRQREWAIAASESTYYDYLRIEVAQRLCDRLEDIKRNFPLALELGCHRGQVYDVISSREGLGGHGGIGGIETLVQCDMAATAIDASKSVVVGGEAVASSLSDIKGEEKKIPALVKQYSLVCDEEATLPFKEASFDAVLSSMNLHWVNDLPSTLLQIKKVLKPDGVFVASMLGGNTLQELRYCFYLAEQERRGGLSSHASPFALASDVASLMQGAGFSLPTVDVDTITISYPDAIALMEHVQRMGEGTAALNRVFHVGSDTFLATAALYQKLYGLEDGSVSATFQVIYMIGWSPHDSQPKPCSRGSGKMKIGDNKNTPSVW